MLVPTSMGVSVLCVMYIVASENMKLVSDILLVCLNTLQNVEGVHVACHCPVHVMIFSVTSPCCALLSSSAAHRIPSIS